jgi:DNA-binding LacI/PurR family transcriptional regulator
MASEPSGDSPRATLTDVCQRSGVSSATVSRVLNGTARVSQATRDRVMSVVNELGYVPNAAARSLAGRREQMLGVIFPEIGNGFWANILKGLDAAAADRGYHLLTGFSHGHLDERELVLRVLREGRIDALILMNLRLDKELAEEAKRFKTPIVLIDRPIAELQAGSVMADNRGGAREALAHLYGHGHRDVAFLIGDEATFDSKQRLLGCRDAANEAGATIDPSLVLPGAFTEESGREIVEHLLERHGRPPRAIFCFNDNLAVGAMEALRDHGWRVPDEVAVIGFDDIEIARHLGLTTVRVPLNEMGRTAAYLAVDAIEKKATGVNHVLSTSLVVRHSCGCPPKRPAVATH